MSSYYAEIDIPVGNEVILKGNLDIPEDCCSLVIFSHGSGSSRFSTRNRYVAGCLQKEKIATLLIDLLTEEEDREYSNRFNIDLLTSRLVHVTTHMHRLSQTAPFAIGYFGASTGAASALKAAAKLPELISSVVSRGGRPDLAANALGKVRVPVLLIVGSLDRDVIILNHKAMAIMTCEKKMEIVNGASHLFEEKGKLDEVATLALHWFKQYFKSNSFHPTT